MKEIAIVKKGLDVAKHVGRRLGAHSPAIFLVSGLALIGTGVGFTVKKTLDVAPEIEKIREETKKASDSVKDGETSEKDAKEIAKANLKRYLDLGRHYLVPASLIVTGVGCIIASNRIQHARIVALSAAYDSLLTVYTQYRERVIDSEGKEADRRYLYGEKEIEVEEVKTDKNGKERKTKKTMKVLSNESQSLYHRCFDHVNSREYTDDPLYNFDFLKMQERIANQKFQAYGYLFLDEVYEALGFSLSDGYAKAKMVGWVKGEGDDYVDFGIYSPEKDRPDNNLFVKGYEPCVWLNFNCDGMIIDKI